MNIQAQELNNNIIENNQAVYELLSKRGRNIFFPKKGILAQSADAKGSRINATIGAAIEDDGSPMRLPSISKNVKLDPALYFPYAPSFGKPDIRARWQSMIVQKNPSLAKVEISVPLVTNALTHGISMAGYMFVDPDEEVLVPSLFWGNYNLLLKNAYDAKITGYNLFKGNKLDVEDLGQQLLASGDKKILLLNFPNNPTGYSPTVGEMKQLIDTIKKAADAGKKIVVLCDDAYFGLFYEEDVELQSPFAYLANLHNNVLAVKIDGPTKEDYVWGFRIGFITYGIKGGNNELYSALENKTAGAIRGNISNASHLSQSLLMQAFDSPSYQSEKQSKYEIMKERYLGIKEVLNDSKYHKHFTALPYNSGYFMCVQLNEKLDGEAVRQLLLKKYSIGVISLGQLLRIAYSSVSCSYIKELFDGIYDACEELS